MPLARSQLGLLGALLSLLAAMALPALHEKIEHAGASSCCVYKHSDGRASDGCGTDPCDSDPCDADCCGADRRDHDEETPAPSHHHDERTCLTCQLIAITGTGYAPSLIGSPACIGPAPLGTITLTAQRAAPLALPRSIPARGPPVA